MSPQMTFGDGAADYARLARDVTRNIASAALKHTPPLDSRSRVLDLVCGSGEVTSSIIENAVLQGNQHPPAILGLDIAEEMIKYYQDRAESSSWTTVSSQVQDTQNLEGFDDDLFDLVFMSFGIMFVPDASRCAEGVHWVLKPGGYAIFTTWKDAGVPQVVSRAAATLGFQRPSPTGNG